MIETLRTAAVVALIAVFVGCRSSAPIDFTSEPLSFWIEPRASKEASEDTSCIFPIRCGDTLTINSGNPGESCLRVEADGTITLPTLGKFDAAGKTFAELRSEIAKRDPRYGKFAVYYSGCDLYYYVSGEVNAPGPKPWTNGTTPSKAIQAAGGFGRKANTNRVKLIRQNGFSALVKVKESQVDPSVYPGDSVHVSRRLFVR